MLSGRGPPRDEAPHLHQRREHVARRQPHDDPLTSSAPGSGALVNATAAPTTLSIIAGPLVAPVMRRVVGMFAARADLPLDRLDDAVLVADMLAANASDHLAGPTVHVELSSEDRKVLMLVGPFGTGGANALLSGSAVPGVGNVIEQLATAIEVDEQQAGEFLSVRLEYTS